MTSLPSRQATLQNQLPLLRDIYARHGLDQTCIDELAPLIAHFEIRMPLMGAFSCGKSSLLNALLGGKRGSNHITNCHRLVCRARVMA